MISFGSILMCIASSIALGLYCYYYIRHLQGPVYAETKFIVVFLFIAGVRLILPLNSPIIVYNIEISSVLPFFAKYCYMTSPFGVTYIFLGWVISLFIGVLLLLLLLIRQIRYYRFVNTFSYYDISLNKLLHSCIDDEQRSTRVNIKYVDLNTSPFVKGLLIPTIFIPANFYSEMELIFIIRHELIHYRKKDLWVITAMEIIKCLFWWNPVVYFIRNQLDIALELSNDLSLLEHLDDIQKIKYGECIVKTAKYLTENSLKTMPSHFSLSFTGYSASLTRERIKHLIDFDRSKKKYIRIAIHAVMISLLILLSFSIMPEPKFAPPKEIEENTFDENDAYFVEHDDGYHLYINGEYWETVVNPDFLNEYRGYKVYKEEPR